jgi:hypothetical protein
MDWITIMLMTETQIKIRATTMNKRRVQNHIQISDYLFNVRAQNH